MYVRLAGLGLFDNSDDRNNMMMMMCPPIM